VLEEKRFRPPVKLKALLGIEGLFYVRKVDE